jgi:hypothetical protein
MQLSTTAEVTVTGEAPLIDLSSTTTGSNYSAKVIAGLPVTRNYAEIVAANPGVSTDRGDTQGRAAPLTIYGATSVENQYIIDGVNTTNVIRGFQGKALNSEFIQEVEVKAGGYQAEYGRALGGVINVITKSGGNEFHGDAFGYYDSFGTRAKQDVCAGGGEPPDTVCNNTGPDTLTGMRISDYQRWDFGADLGGYVWKDRIWFFLAYDRVEYPNQSIARMASTGSVSNATNFPLEQSDNLYSGKITLNITQGTTLTGSVFNDPTNIEGAAGSDPRGNFVIDVTSDDPRTWLSRRDIGGLDWGVRLNQLIGSVGLVQLQVAEHKDRYQTKPSGIGAGIRYDDFTCTGGTQTLPCVQPASANETTGGFGSLRGYRSNNFSDRNMYRGDFTFYLGNNEVKAGADYQKGTTTAITRFTGLQTVRIANEYGQQYYQHDFFSPCNGGGLSPSAAEACEVAIDNIVSPNSQDLGWYVQDSWKALPSLTVNLGLRWDQESVNTFTGALAFKTTNEWQPRIGVIFDPKADGQMKAYAFFGRFYYTIPTDLNVRAYGNSTSATTWNTSPTDTIQDPNIIGHEVPFFQGGAFSEPVQPNLKGIYQDEYALGFDMLLDPSFSVGVKGTYRNFGRAIEDRCDLDPAAPVNQGNGCAIFNPGSDSAINLGQVPGWNGLDGNSATYTSTIPPIGPAVRKYWGGEIVARKQFSNVLWAQASFVYSSLTGNYDGEVREGRGQTDPGINADYDYFAFLHNNDGKLFLDKPISFRLDASYTAPFKMFAGLGFYVQSGAPLNKQGFFNSGYGAEVQLVPRGSAQRLPYLYEMNLTLGYPIALGPVTVTPQVFLFNLLNKQQVTLKDVRYSTAQPEGYTSCSGFTYPAPCSLFDPNQQQTNENYDRFTARQAPRLFRAAIKVSF